MCIWFPNSWWGWLGGVFIRILNLQCLRDFNHVGLFDIFFLYVVCVLSPWGVYIFTVPLHVALWAFSLDAANPEASSWKISVELLLKCFSLWLNPVNFVKSTTSLQVGHQTSQVIQRVWPSIVTQVSIGGGFTCYPAVLLELLYSLLMAALSYPLPPHPPNNVHL